MVSAGFKIRAARRRVMRLAMASIVFAQACAFGFLPIGVANAGIGEPQIVVDPVLGAILLCTGASDNDDGALGGLVDQNNHSCVHCLTFCTAIADARLSNAFFLENSLPQAVRPPIRLGSGSIRPALPPPSSRAPPHAIS